MSDPRFRIFGPTIPPMLGRTEIMERLWNNLTKSTPSHLSLVGPRFAGKSVLLKALDERMHGDGPLYCAVILWDLGHQTPMSDEEFMKMLCQRIGEGLREAGNEYGEHLLDVSDNEYSEIREVIDVLHIERQKVLMLWDGFDKPLSDGNLTRNLWDNLLDLCRKPGFRLVTSTRKELHQLIRDEESVTSDFWGVFESIVRVGPFDEQDVDEILSKIMSELPDLRFQPGAKTELMNWSAGFPPLLLEILNQIIESGHSGQIDSAQVNQAATIACKEQEAALGELWADCAVGGRSIYRILVERGELPINKTGKEERAALVEKGFAVESGSKLKFACRILKKYIQGAGSDAGSMAFLFDKWDDYRYNIRDLLEHRLAQISHFDADLYRYIKIAISFLPNDPNTSLNSLTSIRDRALDMIWQSEFGNDRTIPQELITYWTARPRDRDGVVKDMMEADSWVVPSDRLTQVRLLERLTGSYFNFETKASTISKDTYVLINTIHCFRNRIEHSEGQDMHVGVAVAVLMNCLELLSCLDRELAS